VTVGGSVEASGNDGAQTAVATVQRIRVAAGKLDEFLRRFRGLDVLGLAARAAGGDLVEATMIHDDENVLVVTRWASEAGIDRWLASDAREQVREELELLYAERPVVSRYSVGAIFSISATPTGASR
jgi:heme-degrading monooxygenase HmoA